MSSIANSLCSDNIALIELARALRLVLIPVDETKQPLIRWRHKTGNSADELDAWAASLPPGASGLAVLCGRGRLLVLDIDCGWDGIQALMRACPELLETRTYRTASGGYHLWYLWAEPGEMPAIKRAAGVYDVLSTGSYAVVTGPGRELISDAGRMPAALDAAGLARLISALEPLRYPPGSGPGSSAAGSPTGSPTGSGPGPSAAPRSSSRPPANERERRNITARLDRRITALYHSNAAQYGRNSALFLSALTCKAESLGQGQAQRLLLDEHVNAEGPAEHVHETPQQRRAEGLRTIASAYSPRYRGRRLDELDKRLRDGLPDRARLALLSAGAPGRLAARLADAALTTGLRTFTVSRIAWLVGASRARVAAALRAYPHIFEPRHPRAGRGRPAAQYTIATIERIWGALGLRGKCRASSRLVRPALATIDYRRSLLIQRLTEQPGPIAQAALARGLAVTTRTIRRYIRQAGLLITHHFSEQPITAHNLAIIPDGRQGEQAGAYHLLAGNRRKRLPPRAAIAAYFLRRGLPVWLVKQTASSYALTLSPDEHSRRALRPGLIARLAARVHQPARP